MSRHQRGERRSARVPRPGGHPMAIDEARLEEFIGQFAGDFGAALHASTVVVGDKLGLYRALADIGPTDAAGLAQATSCDTRLVQEWLNAQYVAGYCEY